LFCLRSRTGIQNNPKRRAAGPGPPRALGQHLGDLVLTHARGGGELLTRDEARRIAASVAKLRELLKWA
jgi:hypothetical protein